MVQLKVVPGAMSEIPRAIFFGGVGFLILYSIGGLQKYLHALFGMLA